MSFKKKKIFNSILETIGNTPLVRFNKVKKYFNLYGNILGKLEFFNPLSSVKDRIGIAMINDAEKEGLINSDTTIIEPTSGNTGISLAFICASKGYKLILTMPDTMSVERKKMLSFLGAEIIMTPGKEGMKGAINKAREIKKKKKNSLILEQFNNRSNPNIHFETTANELWEDTNGEIDALVCGVGTGGTLTGIAKFLKEKKK